MTATDYLQRFICPDLVGADIHLRPMVGDDAIHLLHAAQDGRLWESRLTVVPGPETIEQYVTTALERQNAGTAMPFVILDRETSMVIGSTRFWKIDRHNRKLEIGHSWLGASRQRTGVNTQAKYLLLCYAFENLCCVRVQFTTDELNQQSRKAIRGIGAKQEGTIRHERIMPDGRKRNSVRFSIIDDEWPEVKAMLEARMKRWHLSVPHHVTPKGAQS